MDKEIVVISLFDGMSGGQIALNELGIRPVYYASEIDKFAIDQTQLNFPDTLQLGNIKKWRQWRHYIDWSEINLILAGSPCQGFSFAGKQLNFNDPRSKLFFVFVDILNHCKKFNPDVKFLLENVNMKKEYQKVINDTLGLFPVRINSNLVSAQNRDRLYWTNIKIKMVGLFNEIHSDIPQPKDRGILLKDILQPESEIDEKYYLSDAAINRMLRKNYSNPKIEPQKTGAINPKNNSGQCGFDSGTTLIKVDKQGNKKADQNKAGCLTAGTHSGGNHSDMDVLLIQKGHGFNKGGIFEEKSPTLLSNSWEHNNHIRIKEISPYQGDKVHYKDEKMQCLSAQGGNKLRGIGYSDGYKLRRLTPLECARLQTAPSWYIWQCSDTQQYKMLGNGWTIEVIKHILS